MMIAEQIYYFFMIGNVYSLRNIIKETLIFNNFRL